MAMIELLFKSDLGSLFGRLLYASSGPIPLRLNCSRTRLRTGCGCAVERVRAPEATCEYEQKLGPKDPAQLATSPISAEGPSSRRAALKRRQKSRPYRDAHHRPDVTHSSDDGDWLVFSYLLT